MVHSALDNVFAREHDPDGAEKYFCVKQERSALDVFAVIFRLFLVGEAVSAVDLRPAGQPRADGIYSVFAAKLTDVALFGDQRTRTDEAHVARENIEQLRQFVEACPAQELARTGDKLIRLFKIGGRKIRRTVFHRAKFFDFEQLVALADPVLPEYDRQTVIADYYQTDNKHQRRQKNNSQQAEQNVKKTLH